MKTLNFHLLDVCYSDYFSGHHLPVIAVYWDGQALTKAEMMERIEEEYNQCGEMYADYEKLFDLAKVNFLGKNPDELYLDGNVDVEQAEEDGDGGTYAYFVMGVLRYNYLGNTVEKADFLEWEGMDVSLDISLHEYGFLYCKTAQCSEEDEYFVLFSLFNADFPDETLFNTGYYCESDFDELIDGKSWASEEEIDRFLSFQGITKEEWKDFSFALKLHDLLSYYGIVNILNSVPEMGACKLEEFDFYIPSECFYELDED